MATLHPAIELPDSRFDDVTSVGAAQLIADNACAHYFVLGEAAPDSWRSTRSRGARGRSARSSGSGSARAAGANVLGDPRVALAWLVNELSTLGITLDAGQVVTTGTCLVPLAIADG